MVLHTFNSSTWEAEAGGSLGVTGQTSLLHSENLSWKMCVWMYEWMYMYMHIYISIWTCSTDVETNSEIENNWTNVWAFHQGNTQTATKHMKNTWHCNPLKDWEVKIPINILPLLWFIPLKSVGYRNTQFVAVVSRKWCGQFLKVCMAQQFPS